jgi:glycolate oxidase
MISDAVARRIQDIVGPAHVIRDTAALAEYATDATELAFVPDAVVFPGSTRQVSKLLELANEAGFPVIPRGAGSGMTGGALAVAGGVILGMKRFNHILSIDTENLVAKVEPGVVTAHLQAAVETVGLFYPPDPASLNVSTIGGNVAECAGGLRAVKYGVTRDYVLGMKIVLPTGEMIKTGVETMKGVAGYDLTRLIIGSEGTLAVITEITLRLIPKPAAQNTMMAFFPDASSAVQSVTRIIQKKIIPTILEFMDRLCLQCVREEMEFSIPHDAEAMLLIEVDGDAVVVDQDIGRIREACEQGGALEFEAAVDHDASQRLWAARRNVSPALYTLRPHKVNQDIVVPRSRMADLVDAMSKLSHAYGLPIANFGHAGDGNIHVNVMLDKGNSQEVESAGKIVRSLFETVIQMGGTITGEHGVGITKAPYLEMEIPKAGLELMSRIKKAFDPRGILNPGKIFHVPIQN